MSKGHTRSMPAATWEAQASHAPRELLCEHVARGSLHDSSCQLPADRESLSRVVAPAERLRTIMMTDASGSVVDCVRAMWRDGGVFGKALTGSRVKHDAFGQISCCCPFVPHPEAAMHCSAAVTAAKVTKPGARVWQACRLQPSWH